MTDAAAMPKPAPLVSVLMAVHDGEAFLPAALDSILTQTLPDFEFIIVDDASGSAARSILDGLSDRRLVLLRNPGNLGLAASLNLGLEVAHGRYLARMDADDVARPDRLARQVEFLDAHQNIGIVGTGYEIIDAQGRVVNHYVPPAGDLALRWRRLLNNPFAHPTVMLRLDLLRRHGLRYDESLRATQDYDLWSRLLSHTQGANLPEPLLAYRVHPGSVTAARRAEQEAATERVALRNIREELGEMDIKGRDITDLNRLLSKQPDTWMELRPRARGLLRLFCRMFEAFARRHRGESGLGALQRQVAYTVATLALEPPLAPGWAGVCMRAWKLDPLLPAVLAARLPAAVLRRWKGAS